MAAAEPTVTARLVAAWPALAFAVAFELLLQQRRAGAVADAEAEPVEEVVEVVDPLGARVAAMVDTGRQAGRQVGRRTVAKELGVSQYRAGQLLAQVATNGVGP